MATGKWSSGLCACYKNPSNCCLTCCCPCVTFGQIAEIVDEGSEECILSGGIYGALCFYTGCCAWCYSWLYRNKMREMYNLSESPCNDCLVHCCCESCALCQEYRELKHRGYDPALGWTGNLDKQLDEMSTSTTAPGHPNMAK
ncbi:protein PLANT CADMIUM RESISTANCE 2-like [Cryptomeria japonica]|uniref:protein PLANT CADMIUM RESISTANCE 2-like n=1 Tax=Cryptomeria japonica TaxID=3369 RepID=UPI0027DA7B83|nr:protein PLANT CADMIUM RESISTANCE 2-like [Cryptomeria japonica]